MSATPLVSVIIPIYNVAPYLGQCLDSVIGQSMRDLELICLNDGSTDESLAILHEYAGRDARIRVVDKKNSGYGHTVNLGMSMARGRYIGIVESDDFADPDMFATLVELAEGHELDLARCNFFRYSNLDGSAKEKELPDMPLDTVFTPLEYPQCFCQQPSVWANLYRTSFIRQHSIQFRETPGAAYQDLAFSFKVYLYARRFLMTPRPLLYYRVDNELASVKARDRVFSVVGEFAEVALFAEKLTVPENFWPYAVRAKFLSYTWNLRRLHKAEQKLFLRTATREFRGHLLRGQIRRALYSKWQFRRLLKIIFAPWLIRLELRKR
ncbi:glycosyltransferase [Desulfovibrio sp. OttesenSCG-928-A18]|nr:glycosyltransferase [Desulfovibrio sp. OttesenSCG-928-A18]